MSTPPTPGSSPCPTTAAFLQQISLYDSSTNYGYANVFWKPVPRVTAGAGYNINGVNGNALNLNPNAPPGPLQSNYPQAQRVAGGGSGQGFDRESGLGILRPQRKGGTRLSD